MPITYYRLSKPADEDLEDIFDYTHEAFGMDQGVAYLEGFEQLFEQLISNPELGRDRHEIRSDLRSIVKESHTVFYRIKDDHIKIIRVLHGSRDMPRFLEEK